MQNNISVVGIYSIRNDENNKVYIGASVDVLRRISSHKERLIKGVHENEVMQKDYYQYGKDAFSFDVVEVCKAEDLKKREDYFINKLGSTGDLYNQANKSSIKKETEQMIEHGNLLKQMRTKEGMTQTSLSKLLGLSVSNVSRLESNIYELKFRTALEWAKVTNSKEILVDFIRKF